MKDLPDQMQEVLKPILQYRKQSDKRGMGYTKRWILECLFLRIKSRNSYLHLKEHNILPLSDLTTLRKYLRNMKPQCGFDSHVFSILKKKVRL